MKKRLLLIEDEPGLVLTLTDRLVFEPFFRGRTARQAQVRGSGLGLSLVKNTVEAHGGRISVESALGQGSAFTIHLPVGIKRKTQGSFV